MCPALSVGLLEATKWFCYYIISSYVSLSADFDSVSHRMVAVIRSREVAFFGYVSFTLYVINLFVIDLYGFHF